MPGPALRFFRRFAAASAVSALSAPWYQYEGVMKMTSKFSWIAFVPFTIAAVFFKLAQFVLPDGSILGLNDAALDYLTIGCAGVVFVAALILCMADRKISQYYQPHRNIPAGIIGLILALVCAADGANRIYLILSSGKIDALDIIEAILLLLASIVFIVYGLTHSFVNRDSKNFALFNVMPALLCAIRLVRCFVGFTTISIRTADVTLLFCYVFATMFFFNLAVTISLTEAKHAVKSCFIFGFPAVTMLLAYGIHGMATSFNTSDLFANATMIELLLMGLYVLCFLIELSIFIKDRDHVTVKSGDEAPEPVDEGNITDANYVVTDKDDKEPLKPEDSYSYLRTQDIADYLVETTEPQANDAYEKVDRSDMNDYITEESRDYMKETPVIEVQEETVSERRAESDYSSRLDEIDRLILELSKEDKG